MRPGRWVCCPDGAAPPPAVAAGRLRLGAARRRARDELTAITKREISQALVDEAWTRLTFNCEITVTPFEKFLAQAKQVGFLRAKINLQDLIWKP